MRSNEVRYARLLEHQGVAGRGSWRIGAVVKILRWHRNHLALDNPWVRVVGSGSEGYLQGNWPFEYLLNQSEKAATIPGMQINVEGLTNAQRTRWYHGPKGVGAYSVKPDNDGYFTVWYAKPVGPGARQGTARRYVVVDRLTTKRKSKTKAIDRAYTLAYGTTRRTPGEPKPKLRATQPGVAYCLRQKKHVAGVQWKQEKSKQGRDMLTGNCPECRLRGITTKVVKYGKLIDCPECGKHQEGRANDYICVECRAKAEA